MWTGFAKKQDSGIRTGFSHCKSHEIVFSELNKKNHGLVEIRTRDLRRVKATS